MGFRRPVIFCFLFAILPAIAGSALLLNALEKPMIEVSKEQRISADIEKVPLDELLRTLASRNLFEIKGQIPGGEVLTVHLSNATIEQTLAKLMRGYNYVLVDRGSHKPLLVLIGKIDLTKSPESARSLPVRPERSVQPHQPGVDAPPAPPAFLPVADQSGQVSIDHPGPSFKRGPDRRPLDAQQTQDIINTDHAREQPKPDAANREAGDGGNTMDKERGAVHEQQ
jgi:hypothetical protein